MLDVLEQGFFPQACMRPNKASSARAHPPRGDPARSSAVSRLRRPPPGRFLPACPGPERPGYAPRAPGFELKQRPSLEGATVSGGGARHRKISGSLGPLVSTISWWACGSAYELNWLLQPLLLNLQGVSGSCTVSNITSSMPLPARCAARWNPRAF